MKQIHISFNYQHSCFRAKVPTPDWGEKRSTAALEIVTLFAELAFVFKSILGKDTPYFYGKEEVLGSIPCVGSTD
jgi:hypothetical protein